MLRIKLLSATLMLAFIALSPSTGMAHCQVPCGIYDDHARIVAMLEDVSTIDKAVKMINELAGKPDAQSLNQQVRWINTKEAHAENIIRSLSDYFLTQRVKPSQDDYGQRLEKHHAVMLAAMKVKQTVDKKDVKSLAKALSAIEAYYPEHNH